MAQITTGIRSVLSIPFFYDLLQNLCGVDRLYRAFVQDHIQPFKGAHILDIGCGTGALFPYLPDVEYTGIDLSGAYIRKARAMRGTEAVFIQADAGTFRPAAQRYDRVITCNFLHHVDDATAVRIATTARELLKPNGIFVTIDTCFVPNQPLFAHWMAKMDRGRNVRYPEGYEALQKKVFPKVTTVVRHNLLTFRSAHCVTVCSAASLTKESPMSASPIVCSNRKAE